MPLPLAEFDEFGELTEMTELNQSRAPLALAEFGEMTELILSRATWLSPNSAK